MKIPEPQLAQIRARAEGGHAESQFLLSQICLQNGDIDGMVTWLREACDKGVPDAQAALGHCHEKGVGIDRDLAAAIDLYDLAVDAGSVAAGYRKAELLYKSRHGPEKEDEIRALLMSAAAAGFEPARQTAGYLAAQSGTRESGLKEAIPLYPQPARLERQDYCDDPAIAVYASVLNAAECAYLVALSQPHMKHSNVIDPESRSGGMVSDVRTSSGTYLPFDLVDIISRYIELKIVLATGEDLERSEPMSILRYEPGEYYRPHYDYFDPAQRQRWLARGRWATYRVSRDLPGCTRARRRHELSTARHSHTTGAGFYSVV